MWIACGALASTLSGPFETDTLENAPPDAIMRKNPNASIAPK